MINSPCIRHCCLDNHDICVGCFRSIKEITGWQAASEREKEAIVARCEQRRLEREQRLKSSRGSVKPSDQS